MHSTRHFENENLKERSTYIFRLLIGIAGLIGLQFLLPVVRPARFTGSVVEWLITFGLVLFLTIYFLFEKIFVSITFDPIMKRMTLRTMTLLNGTEVEDYNYPDISFIYGKDPGSIKRQATEFVEVYNRRNRLIKLKKTDIGDYSFDNILTELKQLRNVN